MLRRIATSVVLAVSLLACAGARDVNDTAGSKLARSDKPRASAASVPLADVQQQAHDDAAFGFALYGQLRTSPGNLFFSPHSISSALAMTWAGAANGTASAMAGALQLSLPADRVHAALNALDQDLQSRAQAGTGQDGGPFRLSIANAIWAQDGLVLKTAYLDVLAQSYGAGVHLEQFASAPEASRTDINAWVDAATNGKIPELLGPGTVTPDTRLVLTNAVYFNAAWQSPFDPQQTQEGDFHPDPNSTTHASFMHQQLEAQYASGQGWELVELPYSNPDVTMTIIVPASGQLDALEQQLSPAFLDAAVASEQPASVDLRLPRFQAQTQAGLRQALTALGMGEAFGSSADFSGIDGARDLSISDVIHQATISVDERGTEASAATAVVMAGTAAPSQVVSLTVDRPFVVALRDVPTGALLFLGRISQP